MNPPGSVLIVSMLTLLVVTSLGLVVLVDAQNLDQPARHRADHLRAFYLAQSGVEQAIGEIFTSPALPDWSLAPAIPVPETNLGSGSYRVIATLLLPDRAVLDAVGRTAADSVGLTITLERGPGGQVRITEWEDASRPGWTP